MERNQIRKVEAIKGQTRPNREVASKSKILFDLYEKVAIDNRPPSFIYIPPISEKPGPRGLPDAGIAAIQLYKWTEMPISQICDTLHLSTAGVETIVSNAAKRPLKRTPDQVTIYYDEQQPKSDLGPENKADTRITESLMSAIALARGVGLSPEEVVKLYHLSNSKNVLSILAQVGHGYNLPPYAKNEAAHVLRTLRTNPEEIKTDLGGFTRSLVQECFSPFLIAQEERMAPILDFFKKYLPMQSLLKQDVFANILSLGVGDGSELYFLRQLLPLARLTAIDQRKESDTVMNIINTSAQFIHGNFRDITADILAQMIRIPVSATIARHPMIVDPVVVQTCVDWAQRMHKEGKTFVASTYLNFERLILEYALRERGLSVQVDINQSGDSCVIPYKKEQMPTRVDHFVLSVT